MPCSGTHANCAVPSAASPSTTEATTSSTWPARNPGRRRRPPSGSHRPLRPTLVGRSVRTVRGAAPDPVRGIYRGNDRKWQPAARYVAPDAADTLIVAHAPPCRRGRSGSGHGWKRASAGLQRTKAFPAFRSRPAGGLRLSGHELCPPIHEDAPLLEQVRPGVGPLHGASYLVGQRRLRDGMRHARLFTRPGAERGAEAVHRAAVSVDPLHNLCQCRHLDVLPGPRRRREAPASRVVQAPDNLQRYSFTG